MKTFIENWLIKLFLDKKRKYEKKIKQIFYPPMIIDQKEEKNEI